MDLSDRLLLTPDMVKDFDLPVPSQPPEVEALSKIMLAMHVDVNPETIDRTVLKNLVPASLNEDNAQDIARHILTDYYALKLVHRLGFVEQFKDVRLVQGSDDFRLESSDFLFSYDPNHMSIRAVSKFDKSGYTKIPYLICIHRGIEDHFVVADMKLTRIHDFPVYRRMKAARQFLGASRIRHRGVSYLLCVPKDVILEFIQFNPTVTQVAMGPNARLRNYLELPFAKYVMALSEPTEAFSRLAGELSDLVEVDFSKSAKAGVDWDKWAAKHKSFFAHDDAAGIFTAGYNKIRNIHDKLVSLVDSDQELAGIRSCPKVECVIGDTKTELMVQLSLLYHDRRRYEDILLEIMGKVYKIFGRSNPKDQTLCAQSLFEMLPEPDCSSFRNLTFSPYGPRVLPRGFVKGLRGYLNGRLADLNQGRDFPVGFTKQTFDEAVNAYKRHITGRD